MGARRTEPYVSRVLLLALGSVILLPSAPVRAQLSSPNHRGVTFAHVHLRVPDLEPHVHLWTDVIGGEVVEKAGFTAIRIADALIFLTEKEPEAPSTDTVLDHFGIATGDLDALLGRWRTLGLGVDLDLSDDPDTPRAYLTLPGGTRLEVRHDPGLTAPVAMSHVQFATSQPAALAVWYTELFGARQERGTPPHRALIPGAALHFDRTEDVRAPTDAAAIDHIGFEVEDFEAFVAGLRDKGIAFSYGPRYIEPLDLWVVFFSDPSGVVVEVSSGLDTF